MLRLKDTCLHPLTKKPYLKMARGGLENSPEGKQVSRVSYLVHHVCVNSPPFFNCNVRTASHMCS